MRKLYQHLHKYVCVWIWHIRKTEIRNLVVKLLLPRGCLETTLWDRLEAGEFEHSTVSWMSCLTILVGLLYFCSIYGEQESGNDGESALWNAMWMLKLYFSFRKNYICLIPLFSWDHESIQMRRFRNCSYAITKLFIYWKTPNLTPAHREIRIHGIRWFHIWVIFIVQLSSHVTEIAFVSGGEIKGINLKAQLSIVSIKIKLKTR